MLVARAAGADRFVLRASDATCRERRVRGRLHHGMPQPLAASWRVLPRSVGLRGSREHPRFGLASEIGWLVAPPVAQSPVSGVPEVRRQWPWRLLHAVAGAVEAVLDVVDSRPRPSHERSRAAHLGGARLNVRV